MPHVETKNPQLADQLAVETVRLFASEPPAEWDVPRFQRFWQYLTALGHELPEPLRPLRPPIDLILGLRELPDDWDSYGSPPIDDRAVACGLVLLIQAEQENAPAPQVCPVPGGGVQLEWQNGPRALELEALPDGSAQFLRVDGDTMDEGPVELHGLPQVRTLLQWLFAKR